MENQKQTAIATTIAQFDSMSYLTQYGIVGIEVYKNDSPLGSHVVSRNGNLLMLYNCKADANGITKIKHYDMPESSYDLIMLLHHAATY